MSDRCGGTTTRGTPCAVTWGLSPAGFCLMHDPERRDQAAAARAAGGVTTGAAAAAQRNGKYRVVPIDQLPTAQPPRSIPEARRWASWYPWAVSHGLIDPTTSREGVRGINTLLAVLKVLDHERRLKKIERQLKQLEIARE
jgi:hypothetical protein